MIEKNTVIRFIIAMSFLTALYGFSKYFSFKCSDAINKSVECEYVNTPTSMINYVDNRPINLGKFKLTAYCPCVKCCGKSDGITSTGVKAKQGRTIAVDPKVIPYGTKVMINGNDYIAEDCGGAIKDNHMDVFFNNHDEALEFGVKYENVYIVR